jgi:DNA-binding transcriptional ArsR family regulator
MSVAAHNWAEEQILAHPEWAPPTRLLLSMLANHHRTNKEASWPSRKRLSDLVGVSPRNISVHLRVLEDAGVLSTSQGYRDNGSQTSNRYALNLTPPVATDKGPLSPPTSLEREVERGVSTSYFHAGSEAPPSKRTVGARRKARHTGHPDDELDPANAEDLQDAPAPLPEGACPETFERTATRTGRKALCEHFGTLVLGRKFDIIESKPLSSVIRSLQQELDNDVIHGMIHAFAESPRDTDIAQWRLFAAQKSTLHQKVTRQVKAAAPETDADYAEPSAWDEEEPAWKRLAREYREASSTDAAEVCETPATHHEEN